MSRELPIPDLQAKSEKFSKPNKFLLALDGSSLTASSWLSPQLVAMAKSLNIPEQVLGEQCSDLFMTKVVYGALGNLRAEVLSDMGLILDINHFPAKNNANLNNIPSVESHNQLIPFAVAAGNMGLPLFAKGDGDGVNTNHKTGNTPKDLINVWETLRDPDAVAGLKTHFFTDGKSQLLMGKAAMAASVQAGDALAAGITPMPEPDIMAKTSLNAEKTSTAYMGYYEMLMKSLALQFPDWNMKDLGALMGTKLGPVENGEFTGGPSDRKSEEAIAKVAEDTAKLIKDIRDKFGISFYRMLTNGRPLPYMLKVVDGVNKNLSRRKKDSISLGTSFSSAIIGATLDKAQPVIDSDDNRLKFRNEGVAEEFLIKALEASREASAGELDVQNYPEIFDKVA